MITIKSQDGKLTMETSTIGIGGDDKKSIVGESSRGVNYVLGTYKTEKQATEIKERLDKLIKIDYEMPKK